MQQRLVRLALCLASSQLFAYGVSPNRAGGGQAYNPSSAAQQFQQQPGGGFQLQPAPQPSNNLMGGSAPQPGTLTQPQISTNASAEDINTNIRNYKPDDWAKAWGHIHLDEAKKLQADPSVLFCDARAKVEYDQGHIPGAIPLPQGEFETYYKKYESRIKHARLLVTYCHGIGCKLSDKVAKSLHDDHHYKNVSSFFGGWPQWQQNNLPIETGPEPKKR